jgi:Transcriptional regulator
MNTRSVREQLVEHALVLIRRRGFNGFSYRDLADLVGVKTSSIHYYFPSKDDLVLEAVREYGTRRRARLDAIDASLPPAEQARQYLAPLLAGAGTDQACLVGMLSADVLMLPDAVRAAMQDFIRLMSNGWPVCSSAPPRSARRPIRRRRSSWRRWCSGHCRTA